MKALSCWLLLALFAISTYPAEIKPRDAAVRKDRDTVSGGSRWIYNDYRRGFAEAKRTGKPLLVVLRCVPCQACAGIDAAVLLEDTDMTALLDQYILVRVVDANALDLNLFQVDYDLSFSAVFFDGDGTVYGRYGSWRHQKDPLNKTTTGFRRAIEGALALHKGYPANKASLAGKIGPKQSFTTPVEIPTLAAKYKPTLDWDGELAKSCVHCHQVGEALREEFRMKKQPMREDVIYAWPAPETVGLTLAPDEMASVETVIPDSLAAQKGIQAGDEIVSAAGQPMISIADFSWVLNRAPDAGPLALVVRRNGSQKNAVIPLPAGWRRKTDVSQRVGAWGMRGMALGGMVLVDLVDGRVERKIGPAAMALRVKSVGQYGKHAAAKNAGFKPDDIIVEVAGKLGRMSESELLGDLLQHHYPGEQLKVAVLRGSERIQLLLPMQ